MKKYCLGILTALFVTVSVFSMTSVSAEIVESGKMSPLTWTLDDAGTLTISGEGDMKTNLVYEKLWSRSAIKKVNIEEGVTSVAGAFMECKNLETVTIADSVKTIYNKAVCNAGAAMEFAPSGDYDEIKVFTWSRAGAMVPLTEPEAVDL